MDLGSIFSEVGLWKIQFYLIGKSAAILQIYKDSSDKFI